MRNRRAFTLLELIVSISVAGIIALLVYGSASAGLDTRDALDRYRASTETEMRARVLLSDALRHATDEIDNGGVAFGLVDATDTRGLPIDQLEFATRGIQPPLGASPRWTVTLAPTPAGLLLRAVPIAGTDSGTGLPVMSAVLPGIRGLDVEVASIAAPAWSATWLSSGQLPSAVRITLIDSAGVPTGAPIVARVGLEAAR
jgi:prepilin-type N-terminal cleavage/methylation domain-containing protein